MIGSKIVQPESSEMVIQESTAEICETFSADWQTPGAERELHIPNLEPLLAMEGLSTQMERLSTSNSEMTILLMELSQKMKKAMDQINRIRSAVESKKNELKELHGIEAIAGEGERLLEAQRTQKEEFDRFMEHQRASWQEERAWHIQAEKEYANNLQSQRKKEEEEYRLLRDLEQKEYQKKLQEELWAVQQIHKEKMDAMEREYSERELSIREKETEWERLGNELGQFLSNIMQRPKPLGANSSQSNNDALVSEKISEIATIAKEEEAPSSLKKGEEPKLEQNAQAISNYDDASMENHRPKFSSLRELLPSHGRKLDTLTTYLTNKTVLKSQ
jgi:hypothetical protein